MLPLLAVLAFTMLKDGYEDIKRHQSDRFINRLKTRTLVGGGWANPNITEGKDRSISSMASSLYTKVFGGKKSKNSKLQTEMKARASMAAEEGRISTATEEPPTQGPGGFLEQPTSPRSEDIPQQQRLQRRSTTRHSAFDSEYEHTPDGQIMHKGRILSAEEAQKYWSKKAPRWKHTMWEDLAVGDFVMLRNNDPIPADILICSTSEEENTCFIETKNLDGETNLKARHGVPELSHLRTPEDCASASFRVDAEPQDTNMYRLNASVILSDRFDKNGNRLQCPVTLNEILLRGCNLRNTKWVIGIVLMTGMDTKIVANSGATPSKQSKVERQMNPMVYFNLAVLAVIAVACAIADWWLEDYYFERAAYWEYLAVFSDDNPRINGLIAFANALITFQNIVPISLYISIEVVRTIQAYFIYDDYDIYYEKTNRRTTAKSWNLSDELGQLEYIFSDKTGTLTQNMMIFRELVVGNRVYHGDAKAASSSNEPGFDEKDDFAARIGSDVTGSDSSQHSKTGPGSQRKTVRPSSADVPTFKDAKLSAALQDPDSEHGKQLNAFFRCLSLCHTVLVEEHEGNVLEYQAQSPDEQALVQAAADVGFVFCGKDKDTIKLQSPYSDELEYYKLLIVNEFSSARKRMSVVLRRKSDNQLILFAKGADSIMFERAAAGQDTVKAETDKALEEFANKGLRTLCLGYKELDQAYYDDWSHRYHEATVAIKDREERMETLASELESDLLLLGATAIEDKLQDGVPETIADLKRAGIKVWVATGDKLETAIAIGYSTMLLTRDMNLIVVRGGEYGQPNSAYEQLKKAVIRFFGGRETLYQMDHQPPDVERPQNPRRSSSRFRPSMNARRSSVSHASLVGEDNGQRDGGFALVIDGTALGHALSEEFSKDLLLKISTQCRAVICCRVSPLQKALIVKLIKDGLGVMTLAIGDGANDVSMIQAAHVGVGIAGEEGLQAVNSSDYAIAQFRFLKRLVLVHGHWSYYRNSVMITNFFYKNMINIGYLFWFQIYCAWSTTQALEYIYLLLWNAIWTVAAVIGFGIFDRDVSDRVLMEVPELYRRGREGKYFGLVPFLWCTLDAVYQSAVLFFFIAYTYDTTTARSDGYDIQLYEWSTVIALASVFVANMYTGLNSRAWTWWIFAAVWIGPFVVFIFQPIYAAFSPTFLWTYGWGNNQLLYPSIQFWAMGIFCIVLSLMPQFILKHLRQVYYPTDIDILRYVDKVDPHHDYVNDPRMPGYKGAARTSTSSAEAGAGRDNVQMSELHPTASRASSTHYDMLTGQERPNRGYTFSAEDEPRSNKAKRTMKNLLPGTFRRSIRKREERKRLTMIHQEDEDAPQEEAAEDGPSHGAASAQ